MSITVTAAESGSTFGGGLLRVYVLTGTAASQAGAATATFGGTGAQEASITTTVTGSFVYGALKTSSTTSLTAASGTTLGDNVVDSQNTEVLGSCHTTSATGTPGATTVGASAPSVGGQTALLEILPAGTITVDASSPAVVTNTSPTWANLTTAAFTPPAGSLLVAIVSADANASTVVTVSSSGSPALTWTQQVHSLAGGGQTGYAGVWTAQIPAAGGLQDFPQVNPGPTWLTLFKRKTPRPGVAEPQFAQQPPQPPDIPQIQPGQTWLDLFKPGMPRPRTLTLSFSPPPVIPPFPANSNAVPGMARPGWMTPGVPAVVAPVPPLQQDVPGISPGPTWLDLFKPGMPRPRVPSPQVAPVPPQPPDIPQVSPGSTWLALFRPWLQKPRPVPPVIQAAGATGSFALAPLAFNATAGQSSPDIPQVRPGPLWIRLFRPDLYRPPPPLPSQQAAGATGSFSLAPLAFAANAGQTSPDVPQILPGTTWLDLFKPFVPKPRPVPPAVPGISASGSFTLAPVTFAANAGQSSPDQPQVTPGPYWLRLFRPWITRPLPPPPAAQSIGAAGSFALAPLAFSANAGESSPDVPGVQPGSTWLALFKPWQKRRPWIPAVPTTGTFATGSFSLAPVTFAGNAGQSSPDLPQVAPGTTWLRLFRPDLFKPVPAPPAQQAVNATGSLTLAPVAFAASTGQTSPDVPQVQPGSIWQRLFRPWQPRPVPPVPAVQAAGASGSLSLAPLSLAAQGAQSSPDVPAVQPGPLWLRLFRPWLSRPVPPPPAAPAVTASGSITLAPLALSGTGTVTGAVAPDLLQVLPGPVWLRLYKPWVPRPFPPPAAAPAVSIPFTRILITAGEPFTLWQSGSPLTVWDTGDPVTAWETGDPFTTE